MQLLLQNPKGKQRNEADKEMSFYPVFTLEVYQPRLKFGFHNPETFLDLPAFFVDAYDLFYAHIFQVRAYGIEAVIFFFFKDCVRVKIRDFFCACFPG